MFSIAKQQPFLMFSIFLLSTVSVNVNAEQDVSRQEYPSKEIQPLELTVEWTNQFGTSDDDFAESITTDSKGNVYLAGSTQGSLQGTNRKSRDTFVHKYSPNGEILWTSQLNTLGYDFVKSITTDLKGNVYVLGWTPDTDFLFSPYGNHPAEGLISSYNPAEGFIRKYNSSGKMLWNKHFSLGSNDNFASVMAASTNEGVYIAGCKKTIRFDNTFCAFLFVYKYSSSGERLWTKRDIVEIDHEFGSGGVSAITADANGNVYVAGYNQTVLGRYLFLFRYTSSGEKSWFSTSIVEDTFDYVMEMITDSNGNVYAAGRSKSFDFAVVKYSSNGELLWVTQFDAPRNYSHSTINIATNANSNIYITGATASSLENPKFGAFVYKYNHEGNLLWFKQRQHDTLDYGRVNTTTTDVKGNIYVAGHVRSNLQGTNKGGADAFIRKYVP